MQILSKVKLSGVGGAIDCRPGTQARAQPGCRANPLGMESWPREVKGKGWVPRETARLGKTSGAQAS